jgi:hypothetical protein
MFHLFGHSHALLPTNKDADIQVLFNAISSYISDLRVIYHELKNKAYTPNPKCEAIAGNQYAPNAHFFIMKALTAIHDLVVHQWEDRIVVMVSCMSVGVVCH